MRYSLVFTMGVAALTLAACAPSTPYKVTYFEGGNTGTTPWTAPLATVSYTGAGDSTVQLSDDPLPDHQSFTVTGCHPLRVLAQLTHGEVLWVQIEVNGKKNAPVVSVGPHVVAIARGRTC
jgi:hypothetical protein